MSQHRRKACRTCGEVLTLRHFYRHPTTADGLMSNCKTCHKDYVQANREAKREYYRALKRQQDARRKEARRAYLSRPDVRERVLRLQRENYRLRTIEVGA